MFRKILKNWDIGAVDAIEPTSEGGGNTWFIKTVADQYFVLKVSDWAYAEREYKFLTGLSQTELPIAAPVLTTAGNWYVDNGKGEIHCLYPKLPGSVIAEHYTGDAKRRAENFGEALGLLHCCLSRLNIADGGREMHLVPQIQKWALPAIEKKKRDIDFLSMESIWGEVEGNLTLLEKEMSLQTIHRDAHPSNMLFEKGQLTGFLDFELVTRGLRLFDVCYCASAILVAGFEDLEKEQQWLELCQSLLQGYQRQQSLKAIECKCVYEILVAIELIFIAFWLQNNHLAQALQLEKLIAWLEKHKSAINGLNRPLLPSIGGKTRP